MRAVFKGGKGGGNVKPGVFVLLLEEDACGREVGLCRRRVVSVFVLLYEESKEIELFCC